MRIGWAMFVAGLFPFLSSAQPAAPCNDTPAYTPCEMTFELDQKDASAHAKPYESVELRIEFRSPRHRTVAIPAFWDGGRRLVVRFSPTEGGAWDYHVTSNIAAWNEKTGTFNAAASEAPGFLRAANLHHWAFTEKAPTGLDRPHLWLGVTEMQFASMDDAAFRSMVDTRAAQKFTHIRGMVKLPAASPDIAYFQKLDERVRYIHQKGLAADLILMSAPAEFTKALPDWQQRRRYVQFLVGRYAAFQITWEAALQFEGDPDARALLKEVGTALKELDPYQHPRTCGAKLSSTPLLDDQWMDFAAQGTFDDQLGAVEHQVYGVPFVNTNLGADSEAEQRRRLWNATMDGQSPTCAGANVKACTIWADFMAGTRYWELEPYFDVDGGRALALEDTEYVVYIEKPGPLELTVEKHGYDVYWINPADGEVTKRKFSGEHFTAEPPDRSHDWLLHVVRESHLESMNKSYKFASREQPLALQEIEANTPKVPFAIERPNADLSLSQPGYYAVKMIRDSRATRTMMYVWMGDVAADHQGYRILATGPKGTFQVPPEIARSYPALMHLRLYGMNANGKLYEVDAAVQVTK